MWNRDLLITVLTPPRYDEPSVAYTAPRHLPFEVRLTPIWNNSARVRDVFESIPPGLGLSGFNFSGDGRRALVDLNNPGHSGLPPSLREHLEKRIGARVFDPTNRFTQVDAGDPLVARVHQLVSGGAGVRKIWRCDFDGTIRLDTVRPIPQETLESIEAKLGCKVTQHNKNAPVPEYWRRAVEMIAKSEPITPNLYAGREEEMRFLTVHGAAQQVGGSYLDIDEMFRSAVRIAPMHHPVALSDSTKLTLLPAGHHIGSCMSLLEHQDSTGNHRVLYTGDIQSAGDYGASRLYPAAEPVSDLDAVVVEGTNGMQPVGSREQLEQAFLNQIIDRAERNHTVVVPVLTAGRAQEVLALLHRNQQLFKQRNIPVFVDGKSIPQVNQLFSYQSRCYPELFRREVLDMPWNIDGLPVSAMPSEQRQMFMQRKDRKVVIVPGGMGFGPALEWIDSVGRREKSSVVFTCYQAPGTPGYELLHRNDPEESRVDFKFFTSFEWFKGEAVMCRLSGHNSGADTVEFVGRSLKKGGKVVLVHGQSSNLDAIRGALVEQGVAGEVIVAEQGKTIALW